MLARIRGARKRREVPPAQRDEEQHNITSPQLMRNWSKRSTRLCLQETSTIRSLTDEVAHRHPGNHRDVYLLQLRELKESEIACDLTIRLEEAPAAAAAAAASPSLKTSTTIHAHRCIVAARLPRFFADSTVAKVNDEGDEITVVGDNIFVKNPDALRIAIESCYGILVDEKNQEADRLAAELFQEGWLARAYCLIEDMERLMKNGGDDRSDDGTAADASTARESTDHGRQLLRYDTMIVGTRKVPDEDEEDQLVEWSVQAHAAILLAHSEYCRSLLLRWLPEAQKEEEDNENPSPVRVIRLNSMYITEDTVQKLVQSAYNGSSMDVREEPLETLLQLLDGATYLGMNATCLACQEAISSNLDASNLTDYLALAKDQGSQLLLLDCHKYICRNLDELCQKGVLGNLEFEQMKEMLQSDFVEQSEDKLLETVLQWSEEAEASSIDQAIELVGLVRLPFVPVDSAVMNQVVDRGLVNEDLLTSCRLFQTDGYFRASMLNKSTLYRPRRNSINLAAWNTRMAQIRAEEEEFEFDRMGYGVMRMLGSVNGRNKFEKITSIRKSEDHLVCCFPETQDFNVPASTDNPGIVSLTIAFQNLTTEYMPSAEERSATTIDRSSLPNLTLKAAQDLLAGMLRRENALRLHPRAQAAYGMIGEDEDQMSSFTTSLQAHVASEFNVEPQVGIELIRSASTLFPETAKLAHYVRHNRCVSGTLQVGDEAPDVKLATLSGSETSLWKEIHGRRAGEQDKPVVVLGASYT